jgi:hypothetical protein
MDNGLYEETSQRFERLTQERNEVKALPPSMPDFRIDLREDGPPAAEMFERAKKNREFEALRSAQQNAELVKADDMESQVKAYMSWVYIAAQKNAIAFSQTPLRLYVAKKSSSQKLLVSVSPSLAVNGDL